ncbi:LOW QUALITY PROTEIN: embryonic protein UVS.2-like [Discoglossus pictus]
MGVQLISDPIFQCSTVRLYHGDIAIDLERCATKCTHCLWPKAADGIVTVPYSLSSDYNNWDDFEKVDTNNMNFPYDYSSVMHNGKYTYSNTSGEPTIRPKPDPSVSIGQRNGLSELDKVKKLYDCISNPRALLQFDTFDIQPSSDCSSNYINVYDGESRSSPVLLEKACGSQAVPLLVGSVPCGGTYRDHNGFITSPGYPNLYPNIVDCVTGLQLDFRHQDVQVVLNSNSEKPIIPDQKQDQWVY